MQYFVKIISAIFLWVAFIYVILQIPYPDSLVQADLIQLFSFFIPLFLASLLTLNIFIKNILISLSISLGFAFSLILMALDSLNLVTGVLTTVSIYLLISYFKKSRSGSLTYTQKIRKLTNVRRHKI